MFQSFRMEAASSTAASAHMRVRADFQSFCSCDFVAGGASLALGLRPRFDFYYILIYGTGQCGLAGTGTDRSISGFMHARGPGRGRNPHTSARAIHYYIVLVTYGARI